jgi:ribose-phosphate pyrophosphokinase
VSNKYVILMSDYSKQYEQFRYPAGEWQVRLKPETIKEIEDLLEYDPNGQIAIISRIKSSDDLIRTYLLCDAVCALEIDEYGEAGGNVSLIVPYYPYSRADRRFTNGDCLGKSVTKDILGAAFAFIPVTLDIHSRGESFSYFNIEPVKEIQKAGSMFCNGTDSINVNVLFPDKGARERYMDLVTMNPWFYGSKWANVSIYHCEKNRDPKTGKLSGFTVPAINKSIPTIIIDDICDGGGTFLGIAKELDMPKELLGLYVTHGIFSQGFDKLSDAFGHIYTTNSFYDKQEGTDPVKVINCFPSLLEAIK